MPDFFTGTRFIVEAHYPNIADLKTETYQTRAEAMKATERHTAAGANVQIYTHFWAEHKETHGWYPTRTLAAVALALILWHSGPGAVHAPCTHQDETHTHQQPQHAAGACPSDTAA